MTKTEGELQQLISLDDVSFDDYPKFEDDADARSVAIQRFINNEDYTPGYYYGKLMHLYDHNVPKSEQIQHKKTKLYEAVLELEAHKDSGILPVELFELYTSFYEQQLKKIMLVEAAKDLLEAQATPQTETARQAFQQLNHETYGELDTQAFSGIMCTESQRVESFIPKDKRSARIQSELLDYFRQHEFSSEELTGLTEQEIAVYKDTIRERYGYILETFPAEDGQRYNAEASAAMLGKCLEMNGLAAEGWRVEVHPQRTLPATNAEKCRIYLPRSTSRTSTELQYLYLHELEVHARRASNGAASRIKPLQTGTANYAAVEEGAGVILECVMSGDFANSPAFNRARDRYIVAGLALGADGMPKDGRQVYEITWRLIALRNAVDGVISEDAIAAAKKQATVHGDNAFRGTNFATPGVIYSKLKIYYEGLMRNVSFLREHIDNPQQALDTIMIGKYDHTDPVERSLVLKLTGQRIA